jgi:hypothetical protein
VNQELQEEVMNTPENLVWTSEVRGSAIVEPVKRDRPAPIRRRHIVAKHQPRITDGRKWPVTTRKIGA